MLRRLGERPLNLLLIAGEWILHFSFCIFGLHFAFMAPLAFVWVAAWLFQVPSVPQVIDTLIAAMPRTPD